MLILLEQLSDLGRNHVFSCLFASSCLWIYFCLFAIWCFVLYFTSTSKKNLPDRIVYITLLEFTSSWSWAVKRQIFVFFCPLRMKANAWKTTSYLIISLHKLYKASHEKISDNETGLGIPWWFSYVEVKHKLLLWRMHCFCSV